MATGKAFKILSDQMYSDKVLAIVRELSCNAYDAQVDAGNPEKPFDVFLPHALDPQFYIRDYGTGLSQDDLENIYTTYFASTKTNTNNQIGCLGLGSKTPFSYVKMFTVTSFFNGEQYVYSAILNEQGTPAIVLINKSETTEPNGLKVQFAVKKEDFNEFSYKASMVFPHFKTQPKFPGATPSFDLPTYTIKHSTWGLSGDRQGGATAIMGNVAYPVNLRQADFSREEERILREFPVDLFFAIGDLEVASNREDLSYDDRTTSAVRERVQVILNEERKRIENDLDKQPNYWDAVVWIATQKATNQIVNMLFSNSRLSYRGRPIVSYFDIDHKKFEAEDEEFALSKICYTSKWSRKTYGYSKKVSKPDFTWRVNIAAKTKLFVNDCKNRHMVRVKKYFADNPETEAIYLVKTENMKLVGEFLKDLGAENIELLSTIEPPTIVRTKRASNSAIGHFVKMNWKIGEYSEAASCWSTIQEDEDFDIKDGGFYIPITRWKTSHNGREQAPKDYLYHANNLYKVTHPTTMPNVYGIKVAKMKLIENNDKWINWLDHVNDKIAEFAQTDNTFSQLEALCLENNVSFGHVGRIFRVIENRGTDLEQSDWIKDCECKLVQALAKNYKLVKGGSSNNTIIRNLWTYMQAGHSTVAQAYFDKLNECQTKHLKSIEEVGMKYPLLEESYNCYNRWAGIMKLLDYINAVNFYESKKKKTKTKKTN
jgi:hypothetical protein